MWEWDSSPVLQWRVNDHKICWLTCLNWSSQCSKKSFGPIKFLGDICYHEHANNSFVKCKRNGREEEEDEEWGNKGRRREKLRELERRRKERRKRKKRKPQLLTPSKNYYCSTEIFEKEKTLLHASWPARTQNTVKSACLWVLSREYIGRREKLFARWLIWTPSLGFFWSRVPGHLTFSQVSCLCWGMSGCFAPQKQFETKRLKIASWRGCLLLCPCILKSSF